MSGGDSGAFWSYAHEDDRLDLGGIRALAGHVAGEYSLITGEEFNLFIDHSGISWGDAWRSRVDNALGVTTFFIPVITPRYFKRPECRRELLLFHSGAESLGISELLLPILFAPISEFKASNPDELISLVSRYQYVDWTDHRLSGVASPQYRRGTHELAQRLVELSAIVEARQLSAEIALVEDPESSDESGLFDLLDQINALLPDWLASVESSEINEAQFEATWDLLVPRFRRLEGVPGQGGARFAILQRLAQEGQPLAQRQLDAAKIYVRRSVELDPLITKLIRAISMNPQSAEAAYDLGLKLRTAQRGIEKNQGMGFPRTGPWMHQHAHLSRLIRQFANTILETEHAIREGNEFAQRWILEWDRAVTGPD
jgi:hypothetical protein